VQLSDFSESSPGRLSQIDHALWAFVPNPAPTHLNLDNDTIRALAAAERALGKLTGTLRAAGRQFNVRTRALAREFVGGSMAVRGPLKSENAGRDPIVTPGAGLLPKEGVAR